MQHVLRHQNLDPEATALFEVIDRFDAAIAEDASVEALVRLTADVTGRPTGLRDDWSGTRLAIRDGRLIEPDDPLGRQVVREALATRLRGREAKRMVFDDSSALAAAVEVGSGRVGVAWTLGSRRARWRPLDYLATERLAGAVASVVLAKRMNAERHDAPGPTAVARLLAGGLTSTELARAVADAQLELDGRYVVIAIEQWPPNSISAEALAAMSERALSRDGTVVRASVSGCIVCAVTTEASADRNLLTSLEAQADGFELRMGVGDLGSPEQLPNSWAHARECLALGSLIPGAESRIVFFEQLGILHLLAQIPPEEVIASKLFHIVNDSLAHRGNPSDIDVLEAYLEEGTLRRTAARVFLHHTTVEHRLKRIEERLGLDLREPSARFQAQLLLKLQRILRLADASSV